MDGLRKRILEETFGSCYSFHSGWTKIYHDLREVFWWEGLKKDIAKFVGECPNFKQVKAKNQKSGGLLQDQVPTWKWDDTSMEFLVGFTRTQNQNDSIWVVVDRLTKYAQFISVKSTYLGEDYAKIFIDDIMCLHGIPLSIIKDRDTQFISRFWRSFQER